MLTGFESTDSSKLSIPLVLAQLLAFNTAEKRSTTADFGNNADHETPVSIYIAFLIHSKTRSKDLVNRLNSLGLCISYDRLSTLSTQLGNSVVKRFEKDGLVCPVSLRNNVFTTHAVDNINHNPSSRTAQDSWHGTAISASQHLKDEKDAAPRPALEFQNDKLHTKTLHQFPTEYTSILPYVLKKDIFAPPNDGKRNEVKYCLTPTIIVSRRKFQFPRVSD